LQPLPRSLYLDLMPFRSVLIHRIHLVRWSTPVLADAADIVKEIKGARAKVGRPLIGIAIVPTSVSPPEGEVRRAMIGGMNPLIESCESIHFVLEGSGFKNSILRSVVTNILLLAGKKGKVFVHGTLQEALEAVSAHLAEMRISAAEVTSIARNKGLLTPLGGESHAASPP
jgi:hypothetical protein